MGNKLTIMDRIYSNLFLENPVAISPKVKNFKLSFLVNLIKSFFCISYVYIRKGMGITFHWYIIKKTIIAYLKGRINLIELNNLSIAPLDSFRYFEFHFGNNFLKGLNFKTYMDVSSPRFFPAYLIDKKNINKPILINPDKKDISLTHKLFQKLDLGKDAVFINELIDNVNFQPQSFDLISSISVLEHIPSEHVENAIKQILRLIKPGGYLLLSVPVAKNGFEEFINWNEYGLQNEDTNGYYFGQRFHDNLMIEKLFLSHLGKPLKMKIIGENVKGFFINDRFEKLNNINYPGWKESLIFHDNYSIHTNIDSLPGIGVAIFLFQVQAKS